MKKSIAAIKKHTWFLFMAFVLSCGNTSAQLVFIPKIGFDKSETGNNTYEGNTWLVDDWTKPSFSIGAEGRFSVVSNISIGVDFYYTKKERDAYSSHFVPVQKVDYSTINADANLTYSLRNKFHFILGFGYGEVRHLKLQFAHGENPQVGDNIYGRYVGPKLGIEYHLKNIVLGTNFYRGSLIGNEETLISKMDRFRLYLGYAIHWNPGVKL